jgi:hypothetical protein
MAVERLAGLRAPAHLVGLDLAQALDPDSEAELRPALAKVTGPDLTKSRRRLGGTKGKRKAGGALPAAKAASLPA